ncbi:MAG: VOC family protein [Rhodocyclaceae bacterium]|nr:VOC family protein [Rhodocyclaceae bacterium]MBX3667516.1 VOC family protein [Rhodocyclaceae bacterium]
MTHINRLTVVTLGVADLPRAVQFYVKVFGRPAHDENPGVAFFDLPGTWIALYPRSDLAADIGPEVPAAAPAFGGVTLAYNVASRAEADALMAHAAACGARIAKPAQDTFWGGYSGYFADPDGHYWEVVWAPMFRFAPDGALVGWGDEGTPTPAANTGPLPT